MWSYVGALIGEPTQGTNGSTNPSLTNDAEKGVRE
jgi:hypothetical protein